MESSTIQYFIHHLFLPPKLPQEDDYDAAKETKLLQCISEALRDFKPLVDEESENVAQRMLNTIKNLISVRDAGGILNAQRLENALQNLDDGAYVPLHIKAQNAALLVHQSGDQIIFQAFEISPLNKSVMSTPGRIKRSFPASAFAIKRNEVDYATFVTAYAEALAKMSHQSASTMQPKITKAGQKIGEARDTTHPGLITELTMGTLRAIGDPIQVFTISKNTREEVLWSNCLNPWRRSPLWLLVRVVLQLGFSHGLTAEAHRDSLYKNFMIYFLSRILELAFKDGFCSESLYVMQAKLSQRLLKLGQGSIIPSVLENSTKSLLDAQNILETRWVEIQTNCATTITTPLMQPKNSQAATKLRIPELDEFIQCLSQLQNEKTLSTFQPGHPFPRFVRDTLPTEFSSYPQAYYPYVLAAFQSWVELHLPKWIEKNLLNLQTCEQLKHCIEGYSEFFQLSNDSNPERFSQYLLTITEFWIACDRSACATLQLLEDFDMEFPVNLLETLVLPKKAHLLRLQRVEAYVQSRKNRALASSPHIFTAYGVPKCFSVRYFDMSRELQELRTRIEKQANKDRDAKRQELRNKKQQYNELIRLYDNSVCDTTQVWSDWDQDYYTTHIQKNCKRCSHKSQAECINIFVHEWPLPTRDLDAKSTVFELNVPEQFQAWRDVTVYLFLDIFRTTYASAAHARDHHALSTYAGLESFFDGDKTARIGLLSENKPHIGTHRKNRTIDTVTEDDVILNNGLRNQYHDFINGMFVKSFLPTRHILDSCTYTLPTPSKAIQKFIVRSPDNTGNMLPNDVISKQSECPSQMTLDEYKVACSIPLGYRIQWTNILVQLSIPSIDFKLEETVLVLMQTILQAGPQSIDSTARDGHQILEDSEFGLDFVAQLENSIERIKGNWEAQGALVIFTQLASRLLSMSLSPKVQKRCLTFLATVRQITLRWLEDIRQLVQKSDDNDQRIHMFNKIVEIALTCTLTFDVDHDHLSSLLSVPAKASTFVQASIAIQEHVSSTSFKKGSLPSILLQGWKRLSWKVSEIFKANPCKTCSQAFNLAVGACWAGYEAGSSWKLLDSFHDHWITCQTAPRPNNDRLSVHYNLLTAQLLVNGCPLARLPEGYTSHPLHKVLFRSLVLDVMPTTLPGMQFSTKTPYEGFALNLGLKSVPQSKFGHQDMLVRAVKTNKIQDVIPSRLFKEIFPIAFIEDYVHWYDHQEDTIEFRPKETCWSSSNANWTLRKVGHYWSLELLNEAVVGIATVTARTYASILAPLEALQHIHLYHHKGTKALTIELPRLRLGFIVKENTSQVLSKQYRGFYIDSDQNMNTLVGLHSKLVLRHKDGLRNRLVLIPEGEISYIKNSQHMDILISKGSPSRVLAYHLDRRLCKLVDTGDLQSKLFLCYLHILTSFCLPDRLTCKTGAEAAISLLESGALRSFDQLSQHNIDMLELIAKICPSRQYYPRNLKEMQQIEWDPNLSMLSQNSLFHKLVTDIFKQAKDTAILFPETSTKLPSLDFVEPNLLQRDLIRSATFRVASFGAERFTKAYDVEYSCRDTNLTSQRAIQATQISNILFRRCQGPYAKFAPNLAASLWHNISKAVEVLGTLSGSQYPSMTYDSKWVEEPTSHLYPNWCLVMDHLRKLASTHNKFQVMMWLSTFPFSDNIHVDEVLTLVAIYNNPATLELEIPPATSFDLSKGHAFDHSNIRQILFSASHDFTNSPENKIPQKVNEKYGVWRTRAHGLYVRKREAVINACLGNLEGQWPCEVPRTPGEGDLNKYINMPAAMQRIHTSFKTCHDNLRLWQYLNGLENWLNFLPISPFTISRHKLSPPRYARHPTQRYVSAGDILMNHPTSVTTVAPILDLTAKKTASESSTSQGLHELVEILDKNANQTFEKKYVSDLRDSVSSLEITAKDALDKHTREEISIKLSAYLRACAGHADDLLTSLVDSAYESSTLISSAARTRQSPRVSATFFLQQLNKTKWSLLSSEWRRIICDYGLALTALQRAERLVQLHNKHGDILSEIMNPGHQDWSPLERPEWLLLEIESAILIRPVQFSIAQQMMSPPQGQNQSMQLNMGEGKSSVIVPIVAAALADTSCLVRVIVGKPQSKQMLQMLISKLGGLLNRRIYLMPFSRTLRLDQSQAESIGRLYQNCKIHRGILLVHPEHILSFKLMGIEYLLTGKEPAGNALLKTYRFFEQNARDIVDEADEQFSTKFELIYTMGTQRQIELSPERWILIQSVLGLVPRYAREVKASSPESVELEYGTTSSSYPKTRFLNEVAAKEVMSKIAHHICQNGLTGFPLARQRPEIRVTIFKYITEPVLSDEEISTVHNGPFWTDSTEGPLLLLRGLIAGGVLSFAFLSKRYRVNFGLDFSRVPPTRLAVPYRAKDSPSLRSEFSHPDVVIVLTCLAYYYGGLNDTIMFDAMRHLVKLDQAPIEYNQFTKTASSLPKEFRQLDGINLTNKMQCEKEIFPHFRYSKGAIDFFLSQLVFPKDMKEFPHKISASGWDLGDKKTFPLTGFSGTIDSKHTLPLGVHHVDLPKVRFTNALVLKYLLQEENSVKAMTKSCDNPTESDAELLLSLVFDMSPSPRVILDVGAQVLEYTNLEMARRWLAKKCGEDHTKAVVYVNDNDELSVVDVEGRVELFQTSPFATQLENCLVFLDEAHTRGIDLKLPNDYRAAVTLGPDLIKDRLTQACMRMRQLGKGQSVVFCVPPEIQVKMNKRSQQPLGSTDVLTWAIREKYAELRRYVPLWAAQGMRFESQKLIWDKSRRDNHFEFARSDVDKLLEEEAQSLETRYKPKAKGHTTFTSAEHDITNLDILQIVERCHEFETVDIGSKSLQEEQERELSPENETERQVERPAPAKSLPHSVHPDVLSFVRSGKVASSSKAFLNAFHSLSLTTAAACLDINQFPSGILVTADFAATVEPEGKQYVADLHQRPVQFILTSSQGSKMKRLVIISPYEAENLLPLINKHKAVTLHLYAPRPNLEYQALDLLNLYTQGAPYKPETLNPHLIVQLNLFAGQLYLSSFAEYKAVCKFLGLSWKATEGDMEVAADGFIKPEPGSSGFKTSPTQFFRILLSSIRRNCETIDKTHLGRILSGEVLEEKEFQKG